MNPKILIPFLVAFAIAGGIVIGHAIPPKTGNPAAASLPSGRCANAEGDTLPCAWIADAKTCGLKCQREKCHAAGGRWAYDDRQDCLQQYLGAPEAAYKWAACGTCEGRK